MRFALGVCLLAMGCGSADGGSEGNLVPDAAPADTGVKVDSAVSGDDGGLTLDAEVDTAPTTYPVRKIPGLKSITYYERSGGTAPTAYTFTVDGPEMTTFLTALDDSTHDIKGVTSEFYDVYYSDADGKFDIDGRYLTISGVFAYALPAGGGLNLAEIVLNYDGGTKEYGNYVASFKTLGDNASPTSVSNCIDGNLDTHSTMGNTVGSTERLRITLGFKSSSGPPK